MNQMSKTYRPNVGDMFIVCRDGVCNLCKIDSTITLDGYIYIKSFKVYIDSEIEEVDKDHELFEIPRYAQDKYVIESWREQTDDNLLSFPFSEMNDFLEILQTLKSISDWENELDEEHD